MQAPKKDYEANVIVPGQLQLPAGSTLLVDETGLAPGKVRRLPRQSQSAPRDNPTRL